MNRSFLNVLFITIIALACVQTRNNRDEIDVRYEESTIGDLDDSEFERLISMGELKEHGDFGIGTLDGIDGETVDVNDEFFQSDYKGAAQAVDDNISTPFAMVTFFESDKTVKLTGNYDYNRLKSALDEYLPSKDIIYAIKIMGEFDYIQTRSVPRRKKPHAKLEGTFKEQSLFELEDTKGTAVGFWVPSYMKEISVRGYHLHFISEDKTAGGHILELTITDPTIYIDFNSNLNLSIIDD